MEGELLPTFVCVGASKCGTTSLYHYLRQHPDIFLPEQKELHFHSAAELNKRSNGPGTGAVLANICTTLDAYNEHYRHARPGQLRGDISPSYFNHPGAAGSIASKLHNPRIIIMLRNPVDKVFSQYMHLKRAAREPLTFEEALHQEDARDAQLWGDMWLYAQSGYYAEHVERYLKTFGRNNVLILLSETFQADPRASLKRVWEFLGVDSRIDVDTSTQFNKSGSPRSKMIARLLRNPTLVKAARRLFPLRLGAAAKRTLQVANTGRKERLEPATRAELEARYGPDVSRLEALVGFSTGWFKSSQC